VQLDFPEGGLIEATENAVCEPFKMVQPAGIPENTFSTLTLHYFDMIDAT